MRALPPPTTHSDTGPTLTRRGLLAATATAGLLANPSSAEAAPLPNGRAGFTRLTGIGAFRSLPLKASMGMREKLQVLDDPSFTPRPETVHDEEMTHTLDGIPLYQMGGRWTVHPTWATTIVGDWIANHCASGNPLWLRKAASVLDGLARRATRATVATHPALFTAYESDRTVTRDGVTVSERSPWYSSFGNSRMVNLCSQMFHLTGEQKWRVLAEQFLWAYAVPRDPSRPGAPWISVTDGDGYLWLEAFAMDSGDNTGVINTQPSGWYGIQTYRELVGDSTLAARVSFGMFATMDALSHQIRRPGRPSHYYHPATGDYVASYHRVNIGAYVSLWHATGHLPYLRAAIGMYGDWPANTGLTYSVVSSGQPHMLRVVGGRAHEVRPATADAGMGAVQSWTPTSTLLLTSKARKGLTTSSTWTLMADGPRAGWWIRERRGAVVQLPSRRALERGLTGDALDAERPDSVDHGRRPVPLRIVAGATVTARVLDFHGHSLRTSRQGYGRAYRLWADRTAFIDGVLHARVMAGALQGMWVELAPTTIFVDA